VQLSGDQARGQYISRSSLLHFYNVTDTLPKKAERTTITLKMRADIKNERPDCAKERHNIFFKFGIISGKGDAP